MTAKAILTRNNAAEFLDVTARTLKRWWNQGRGPRGIKRGDACAARVVYRVADLESWVASGCPMTPWAPARTSSQTIPGTKSRSRAESETPERKRPATGTTRSRAKDPPQEGGNDGRAYRRPPGRQPHRRRARGSGRGAPQRTRVAVPS